MHHSSFFFFSSRRRHTRLQGDWSSDVCSSDLGTANAAVVGFITDGIERLAFNAAIGETSGSATFDIRFDVNAADAHVRLRMTLTAPDQNTLRLAINFRLQFGSEVVTVTGTQTLDLTTLGESATVTVLVDVGIY